MDSSGLVKRLAIQPDDLGVLHNAFQAEADTPHKTAAGRKSGTRRRYRRQDYGAIEGPASWT
jgi:hypothetical protein